MLQALIDYSVLKSPKSNEARPHPHHHGQSVIQRYLSDPLLLRNHKFDLRIYVLVTAFQPRLEAFIYRDGFARFCTRPFALDDLADPLVHLTNSSVQRKALRRGGSGGSGGGVAGMAEDHPLRTAPATHVGASKLRLSYLFELLQEEHGAQPEVLWKRIKALVVASLVCVEDCIPACPHGFELFGYDVLLDSSLRPWLLEVNASPSMARENALDADVKEALIFDTLRLVNPVAIDHRALTDALSKGPGPGDRQRDHQRTLGQGAAATAAAGGLREGASAALRVEERHRPRQPGEEVPAERLGRYERLCPDTKLHKQILAHKRRGGKHPQQQQQHRDGQHQIQQRG